VSITIRGSRSRGYCGGAVEMAGMEQLPSGIPKISDLDKLKQSDTYQRHVRFNREFLAKHQNAMAKYGKHWGLNPFNLWSRRWEYPFVAQRVMEYARQRGPGAPLRVLDAGSGVTYFPYYIIENLPQTQFVCCDYDASYATMFADINRDRGNPNVSFVEAMLQKLPMADASLEHTNNYGEIVNEFARVLKPGGLFVLTFDLSLDGKFTLPRPMADELLKAIGSKFSFARGFDPHRELDRMKESGNLTSDHVRATEPALLPWSMPARVFKAVQDLFTGRGWTCGFRSRTIFCVDVVKN
jgi:SAM-dependent methyltransferase